MVDPASPSFPASASQPQRVKEFFLARQPILNRDQELFAYELLFRTTISGPANVTNDIAATASVIAHAAELGMENVLGASRGFINVDAAVLASDFIRFLPRRHVVLEILETVRVTDELIERVAELAKAGYVFALDDVTVESEDVRRLLPLVDIVKVDINTLGHDALVRLSSRFKSAGKLLLAEKVENLAQFQDCLNLGFDYFQGYYFARPLVMAGHKLSPSQIAVMQLMGQLAANADIEDIERSIKQDASLALTLLRLVNTAAAGAKQHIDSLRQALELLGREQFQHWLQILLYAEPGKQRGSPSPLLALATTRGKLLELIAEKNRPGNRNIAGTAFTVGIMSLMEALFDLPMEKILERFPVAQEVRDALLFRRGLYGDMLALVEAIERISDGNGSIAPLLAKLGLSVDALNVLQLKAFEWSDALAQSAGDLPSVPRYNSVP